MKRISQCRYPGQLLSSILDPFEGIHILVLGDLLLDHCVYAERLAERRYKQPGLDVLKYAGGDTQHPGGAGAIARAVQAYGGTVDLCAVIGRDAEGSVLKRALKDEDVTFHPVYVKDRPTTVVHRFFVRTGRTYYEERLRADRERDADLPDDVIGRVIRTTRRLVRKRRPDAVIIADFGRGVARKKTIDRIGSWLNREGIPIIVDPHGDEWQTWKVKLAAVFPTVKEAWDALRRKDEVAWMELGADEYPPQWSSSEDCGRFVQAIMEVYPNVHRFCVNDHDGSLLAIARDEKLHGRYNHLLIDPLLIDPARSYRSLSPVGSESVPTGFLALALSTGEGNAVCWDDFFLIAYAAKCLSWVNMSCRTGEIAGPGDLADAVHGPEKWTWADLPKIESILTTMSEREVNLQRAIEDLSGSIQLRRAQTDIPGVVAANPSFRDHLKHSVRTLQNLMKERPLKKPARLWVHGPSRIGKDFVVEQLVKEVLKCEMKKLGPNRYDRRDFDVSKELQEAQRKGQVLVADELDKSPDVHRKFLIPLENPALGNVLFVAMTSGENIEELFLRDLRNRLDPKVEALALRIELPAFEDRMEDVPYLLVACLQRWARENKMADRMPSKISKRALEALLRSSPLNMQIVNDVADRLVRCDKRGTIDFLAMVKALNMNPEDVGTPFYPGDHETVSIEPVKKAVRSSTSASQ